jgi:TolB-like protein/DNA-binding winged helix-turn-helix (wHTH) protein/Tfp pilus assembly protein PilF
MDVRVDTSRVVRFGAFELDRRAGELRKDGLRVRLQEQPLRILDALLSDPGEPVTREELRKRLWPDDTFVDFDNGLNRAINRLRAALGDDAGHPRFVETLERRGYRFIAPVVFEDAPTPPGKRPAPRLPLPAALLAVVVVAGIVYWGGSKASGTPPIRTLAVLPLANLTGDPGQDYFSDGMTDALITRLAALPALHVISRQSVMAYKASAKSLPEIASELGVEGVVEGSVVRSGSRVRVTAQLVHGPSDRHLWAQSFDRELADVLTLQAEIAAAVAAQVERRLGRTPGSGASPSAAAVNPQAYELYLRGQFRLHQLNPASLEVALDYFAQARDLDPAFAPAYAGLAVTTFMQEFWGGRPRSPELVEEVRRALARSLELDPNLSAAHDTLGRVRLHYDYDWAGAETAFRRAVALEPSSMGAHNGLSLLLQTLVRQDEALAEAAKAVSLDPLSPTPLAEEGRALYRARRFDEAEERFRRALALDPGFGSALDRLVQLDLARGRLADARDTFARLEQLPSHRGSGLVGLRARLEAAAGNDAAARRLLATLPAVPNLTRVAAEVALGNHDAAFSELTRAVAEKTMSPYGWANPELDPLRADARFAVLVRRMGLPVERLVGLGRPTPSS